MSKAQKIIILILAAALVAVSIAAGVVLGREPETVAGEFTAPEFDPTAVAGEPVVPQELGWCELPLREGLTASVCGVLTAEQGRVAVWLYNHPDSDCWLKLRLLDSRGNILGETGLLKPGEHVQYLNLDTVPRKDTAVVLKLMAYRPETYYSGGSAGLETTLMVP